MYIQMKDVVKKYGEGENTIFALDHASQIGRAHV